MEPATLSDLKDFIKELRDCIKEAVAEEFGNWKLDELSDLKSGVKELEATHDNVADALTPAEETADIVPELTASAASAKSLDIDATGVAAPTPTSCSTDGLNHNADGDDPMVACQAAWSRPTSFTMPPGDSPTASREPAFGLALGALAHTKYSTEGSKVSVNSMVRASTSGAPRSAAVTTVLLVDIQLDTAESLEVVPVITNSNGLGVEPRPLPWPSFEGNQGRALRVRRVPSLKERRSQKQWSMLAYWGILELTHVILHNPRTSIFDSVLQWEFGGHTSMGIATRIQLPVLLILGHCSLFWTTILAGNKHHLQVIQIIATLLSILPGPGIHLPSYTQHGKYLSFFQPKPPCPHPQVICMRLSLDVAESGCCYSAILASGEPPMCLEYEKLLHWFWGGAMGITSRATTLFLAQIFTVYLNIGVIKLTQPCMVQLLTVRANCSTLSDYQTVQLFSCRLITGWPSELIITEVSLYAPLRNANRLLGVDISIGQQKNSVKLCLFSEMWLACKAAMVLKSDGIQGYWLGGFFLFAQSNNSKDIIHVHAANDGDALFVTGNLTTQQLLHRWWIFNYQRRFQEVFTVADHPQATLNSLLSGGTSVFQLWPSDKKKSWVRRSNSLLNSAETNAELLPDPIVTIQLCWSSLSCVSFQFVPHLVHRLVNLGCISASDLLNQAELATGYKCSVFRWHPSNSVTEIGCHFREMLKTREPPIYVQNDHRLFRNWNLQLRCALSLQEMVSMNRWPPLAFLGVEEFSSISMCTDTTSLDNSVHPWELFFCACRGVVQRAQSKFKGTNSGNDHTAGLSGTIGVLWGTNSIIGIISCNGVHLSLVFVPSVSRRVLRHKDSGLLRLSWDPSNKMVANLESGSHWQDVQCGTGTSKLGMIWDPGIKSVDAVGIQCSYFLCTILSGLFQQAFEPDGRARVEDCNAAVHLDLYHHQPSHTDTLVNLVMTMVQQHLIKNFYALSVSNDSPTNFLRPLHQTWDPGGFLCSSGHPIISLLNSALDMLEADRRHYQMGMSWDPGGLTLLLLLALDRRAVFQGRRCDMAPAAFNQIHIGRGYCFDQAYYYFDQVPVGHNYYLDTFLEQASSSSDYYINDACFFDLVQVHLNHGYYHDDYHGDSDMIEDLQAP